MTLIFIGCGKDKREGTQYHEESRKSSKTIAKVGQSEIKMAILEEYDQLYQMNFTSADEEYETKKAYVDSLIDIYIFTEAAYDQGLDKDPELQRVINASKADFLRDELFKKKILPRLEVSEDEIKKWYSHLDKMVRISTIFLTDSILADSINNAIQDGADYEAMARKFSEDLQSSARGGDIGFRAYPSLSEYFQDEVFD